MAKPKPLQYYENIEGEPGKRIFPGEVTDTLTYDISLGKKITLFVHNPNHNTACKTSELFINDANIKFHTQEKLMPLETAKAYIEIEAMREEEIDQLIRLDEYTEEKTIGIEGDITWQQLGVRWGDSEKLYGW